MVSYGFASEDEEIIRDCIVRCVFSTFIGRYINSIPSNKLRCFLNRTIINVNFDSQLNIKQIGNFWYNLNEKRPKETQQNLTRNETTTTTIDRLADNYPQQYKVAVGDNTKLSCAIENFTKRTSWRRQDGKPLPSSAHLSGGDMVKH